MIRRAAHWGLVPLLSLVLVASAAAATTTGQAPPATTTTGTTTEPTTSTTSTTTTSTTTSTTTTPTSTTPITTTKPPSTHTHHRVRRHHRPAAGSCPAGSRAHRTRSGVSCRSAKHRARHHTAKPPAAKPHRKARHQHRGAQTPSTTPPSSSTSPSGTSLSTLPLVFTPSGSEAYLINTFQIPPFLLPIYQAAAIQYDVPWAVLAAINWIETDYGRNLSVSSAGAVGWMQFLPSTWKEWGVDATGSGFADPYNPVDAIFAAARYLQAAGAGRDLSGAVLAYNHASWYVRSVLLRAKLIDSLPGSLVGALTQMVQGRFPVAADARYRDSGRDYTDIAAAPGAPVVAVNDGTVVAIGHTARLGLYVKLRDAAGNLYTYAHLGRLDEAYAVPKPHPARATSSAVLPGPRPNRAASAGTHGALPPPRASRLAAPPASRSSTQPAAPTSPAVLVKERLFAHPLRPASYAAGGVDQVAPGPLSDYLATALHLRRGQYVLRPLRPGAIVVAGTILGHLGRTARPSLRFMIDPAGRHVPAIDPKSILDGWKLLAASALFRRAWANPDFGPGASNPTIGQELLMSKGQLATQLLANPKLKISACGRRDIQAGLVDRRVLAALAFLAQSGLDPTVSGLACSDPSARGAGQSVNVTAVNGTPVLGHQGAGSVTDQVIRHLLTLQGAFRPAQIVSLRRYPGQANTLALPDHSGAIQISYAPAARHGTAGATLSGRQWRRLVGRLGTLPEPAVPLARSRYAFAVHRRLG